MGDGGWGRRREDLGVGVEKSKGWSNQGTDGKSSPLPAPFRKYLITPFSCYFQSDRKLTLFKPRMGLLVLQIFPDKLVFLTQRG